MDAVHAAGLRARIAHGEDHEPLCIEPGPANTDGLYVSIYTRGGQITAVEVFDGLTEGSRLILGVDPPKEAAE